MDQTATLTSLAIMAFGAMIGVIAFLKAMRQPTNETKEWQIIDIHTDRLTIFSERTGEVRIINILDYRGADKEPA